MVIKMLEGRILKACRPDARETQQICSRVPCMHACIHHSCIQTHMRTYLSTHKHTHTQTRTHTHTHTGPSVMISYSSCVRLTLDAPGNVLIAVRNSS